MLKIAITLFICMYTLNANSATTKTVFSGPTSDGILIADWDTGDVFEFYVNTYDSEGNVTQYTILEDYNFVEVIQDNNAVQYFSDGTVDSYYAVSPDKSFSVRRYAELADDPNYYERKLSIVFDDSFWSYSEEDWILVPCGEYTCTQYTHQFLDIGDITSWSMSAVPIPAALWLFGSGIIGLIGIVRIKRPYGER